MQPKSSDWCWELLNFFFIMANVDAYTGLCNFLQDNFGLALKNSFDRSDETVALTWNRNDKTVLVFTFAQRFSQGRDLLSKIIFLDHRIKPKGIHQLIFSDNFALPPDQNQKCV